MELHLKKWVKVMLVVVVMLVVFGLFRALHSFEESEVKNCMEYGHSEQYCRSAK